MRQAYSKLGVRDENSFANHHSNHVDSVARAVACVLSLRLQQLGGQRFSWPASSCCSSPPQHEVRPPIIDAPYVLERACM